MKNKTFLTFGLIFSVVVSLIAAYINSGKNSVNDLFITNVEALTRAESGLGPMCSQTGVPGTFYMHRCPCKGEMGSYDMDRIAYCR